MIKEAEAELGAVQRSDCHLELLRVWCGAWLLTSQNMALLLGQLEEPDALLFSRGFSVEPSRHQAALGVVGGGRNDWLPEVSRAPIHDS